PSTKSNSAKLPSPSFQTDIQQETTSKKDNLSNEIEPKIILAEKTEELTSIEYEEDKEIASLLVGNIIYPAIVPNAKYNLFILFNELPLL
ncbi:2656_t:CDS:2, partial [Gigaspora rosea]